MSLLMRLEPIVTSIIQVSSKISFSKLEISIQDPGGCQLWVRGNQRGVETSCTPSLTSSILTSCPDTRGHRVKAPGEKAHSPYSKYFSLPRHTLVLGCGASAVTCLSALRRVGVARGGVAVTWVTRRGRAEAPYNVVQVSLAWLCHQFNLLNSNPQNDPLPQRESLYRLGNRLALESEQDGFESFQYKDQTQVTSYTKTGNTIRVTMENITTGNSFILLVKQY